MLKDLKFIFGTPELRVPTIALFTSGFAFAATLPYMSIVAINQLGLSEQQFGLTLMAAAIISTLSAVIISHFSDMARNRRQALLVSYTVGFLGYGAFAVFPSVPSFLAALLIFAPIAQSATPQIFAVIRARTSELGSARAAAINSLIRTIFAGSWIVTPGLSGAYIAWTGRASDAFSIASLAYAATFVLYASLGPSGGRATPADKGPIAGLIEAFRLVFSGHIVGRMGALAVIAVAYPVNAALLPIFLVETLGETTREVGMIAGFVALLEIPAMLAVAAMVKRTSVVTVIAVGGGVHVLYVLALSQAGSMTWVYVLCVANAIGAAALFTQHLSYLQDLMPDRPGLGTSLQSIQYLVMRALGAVVVACVGVAFGLAGAFVVTGVISALGIAALLWIERGRT